MDFPGGSVVKTPCFQCRDRGFHPGQGTRIRIPSVMAKKFKNKIKAALLDSWKFGQSRTQHFFVEDLLLLGGFVMI